VACRCTTRLLNSTLIALSMCTLVALQVCKYMPECWPFQNTLYTNINYFDRQINLVYIIWYNLPANICNIIRLMSRKHVHTFLAGKVYQTKFSSLSTSSIWSWAHSQAYPKPYCAQTWGNNHMKTRPVGERLQ
jgi:hypothetical protein